MKKEQVAIKATRFSITGNLLLAIIKATTGYFGHSYALIADAIESTSDIFASVLVLIGIRYSSKPADKNHPYGHGKIEPLVTFIVVAILLFSASVIVYESIHNILTPHEMPEPWTLYVLGLIIIWKEISYRYVIHKSKKASSTALIAEAWHHRSDAITSVAAFAGIVAALLLGEGYENMDDWAALLASVFILYNCYKIFKQAFSEIMEEHLYDDFIEAIRNHAVNVPGVRGTEKCFIRKSGMQFHVDLHAIVDGSIPLKEAHSIAHALIDYLKKELPEIGHISVHVEPEEENIISRVSN